MDRLELQKLRDLPIEGVAERLGLKVARHKSLCPFHDDHTPSCCYSVSRNTFRCFACGASGGVIDLVMKKLGVGFKEACRWLGSPSLSLPQMEGNDGYQREKACGFDPKRYERFFERPWLSEEARRFLFTERRLDERVVRWCRVSSWRDGKGVNWLQIPYFDVDGRLIGVQNRNLNPSAPKGDGNSSTPWAPRFRFPQGSRCSIYNLPVLKMLRPGDELWITEGASDCWAMLSSGRKAIAIPSATLLMEKDKELLRSLSLRQGSGEASSLSLSSALSSALSSSLPFKMYPDRDEPGERLFMQLKEILPELEHCQLPVGCKDFAEYYARTRT